MIGCARASMMDTVTAAPAKTDRPQMQRHKMATPVDSSLTATAVSPKAPVLVAAATAPAPNTNAQALPKFIPPDFGRTPPELKQLKNWVLWVPIWTGSKWTKRPVQPSGFAASTTNAKHWSSFVDVKQAYERAIRDGYIEVREKDKPIQRVPVGGVGFVFDGRPDENGLVFAGVDFDKVISENEIASLAQERVKRLKSYTEISVSRCGLHVILKAKPLQSGIAHDGVEMYTTGRYFTMTGCALKNAQIVAAPQAFAALAEELRKESGKPPSQPNGAVQVPGEPSTDQNLDDFEGAALYLAALNPSPFKDYHGWRNFTFACAYAEITHPADAERVRDIWAGASAKSGGDTANNDKLYDDALAATQAKIVRGEKVITVQTVTIQARAQGWSSQSAIDYFPGNEATCRTALDNVVAADPYTFKMGDRLVILRLPDQTAPAFERWSGDLPGTTPALPADIIERAERLAWMTRTGGKGEQRSKRSKPPRDFCTDYLPQRRGRYAARPLVGISRVPYMGDAGSIRNEPGYDPQTGIYLDRPPNLIIPDRPSLDDAKDAFDRVMKPFEHYTFDDAETGPLLVFAANVTALERQYMKTAPMFVINGAQAGTGKGQMCLAIGNLALGTAPPFMAWGHDDDEFKKRLDTMLLASPAMLVIDNCNGRLLRGDTLEMILTEGRATLRPLGKSEAVAVSNRTFFMANGNNLQISGDMSRRSLKIGILPGSANPERASFPFTPEEYVVENRNSLLSDYYTIMRAYRLACMPRGDLPAVGSFSEWERKVRDPVYWLTAYDLSEEFDKNKGDDPLRQNDAAMLAALSVHFGEKWFKASEVEDALKQAADFRRAVEPENRANFDNANTLAKRGLLEAAEQVFGSKPVNAKSLGYWAKGVENAFTDGFVLRRRIDPHSKSNQLMVEAKNE